MNDPIALLREHLPGLGRGSHEARPAERHSPDPVQMLTAKILLFTGVGTAAEALRGDRPVAHPQLESAGVPESGRAYARPISWGPAILGGAAAIAHAVHAFGPTERTRLATRTFDLAVVGVGLLSLADTLAAARRNGSLPSVGSVSLASAGLLGILLDRAESRHLAERERLERRASVVERLVPRRRPRLDRIVVHV